MLCSAEANSSLVGDHQAANAETAVAAAANLASQGFSQISKSSIKAGLESAVLPGRFQVWERWTPQINIFPKIYT